VLHGAKETLARFQKDMELSTEHATGFKGTNFQVPPIFAEPKLIQTQLKEINGKAEEYHCAEYKMLLDKVVPLRKDFRRTQDVTARKQISKEEFDAWTGYLELRRAVLPKPDFVIDEKEMSLLKENFDRFKDRKTHAIKAEDLVEFHHDYSKKFKFRVPLHPKNLQQMIHPHFGYLANFLNRQFAIGDLVSAYENQIVSSFERSVSQDILGDELACLGYWLIEDAKKKGYFSFQEVIPLLTAFRFDTHGGKLSLAEFKKEFKFLLLQNTGEIKMDTAEEDVVIRFDLVRQIFLERGL